MRSVLSPFIDIWIVFLLVVSGCSFKKEVAQPEEERFKLERENSKPPDTDTLQNIVASGDLSEILQFLRERQNLDLNRSLGEETALSIAIRRGDFEVIALLISYGASPFVSLSNNGPSAYENIEKYSPRVKSVISAQVEVTLNVYRDLIKKNQSDKVIEYFDRESLPCALALENIKNGNELNRYLENNKIFERILQTQRCKNLDNKFVEKLAATELLYVLKSGSRDLSLLKLLVNRSILPIKILSFRNDFSNVYINPVFLISERQFCDGDFSSDELKAWRNELTILFPNFSGIAWESEPIQSNSTSILNNRLLITEFSSRNEGMIAFIQEFTGIKNFFKCGGNPP